MLLNFAREGEQPTDACDLRRVRRYYFWLRAGVEQREACRRAVGEVDRWGLMEGEHDDAEARARRVASAAKVAAVRRQHGQPKVPRSRSAGGHFGGVTGALDLG